MNADGMNVEVLHGILVLDDRRVPNAVDQFASDPGIDRGYKIQPQARNCRSKNRDRDHEPFQSTLTGIFFHDSTIGSYVRSSDFVDAT